MNTETSTGKKVGLAVASSLVVGNMIASGIYMLPTSLSPYGGLGLIGWLLSGLGAICLAIVFGRLSKLVPDSHGGPYAYTRKGLGEGTAFLVAWTYWISVICTNAALTITFVSYLSKFLPILSKNHGLSMVVCLGTIWSLTWVNSLGIRKGGAIQVVTTILKLIPLFVVTAAGMYYFRLDQFSFDNTTGDSNLTTISKSTTLTLFAFLGLECATIPSGNIDNPQRTIPKATMFGTGITTLIYVMSTVGIMVLLPATELGRSAAPFADAAYSLWGSFGRYAISLGAMISVFGALNGWILIQGQIPYAAANDRLFPGVFRKENANGVPIVGIVISSLLASILMGMSFNASLASAYEFSILLSTVTVLVPYACSVIALLVIDRYHKSKISTGTFAVTGIAMLYTLFAVFGSGVRIFLWGLAFTFLGIIFFRIMRFTQA